MRRFDKELKVRRLNKIITRHRSVSLPVHAPASVHSITQSSVIATDVGSHHTYTLGIRQPSQPLSIQRGITNAFRTDSARANTANSFEQSAKSRLAAVTELLGNTSDGLLPVPQ